MVLMFSFLKSMFSHIAYKLVMTQLMYPTSCRKHDLFSGLYSRGVCLHKLKGELNWSKNVQEFDEIKKQAFKRPLTEIDFQWIQRFRDAT